MEAGVDPLNHMEDDLHIPHLQIEYPYSYDVPHFGSTLYVHHFEPRPMPSFTEPPHFEQPPYFEQPPHVKHLMHYSPFSNPHYSPPLEEPSLHEFQTDFHALRDDLHEMRYDITRLLGTFEESSILYGAQFSSLHH